MNNRHTQMVSVRLPNWMVDGMQLATESKNVTRTDYLKNVIAEALRKDGLTAATIRNRRQPQTQTQPAPTSGKAQEAIQKSPRWNSEPGPEVLNMEPAQRHTSISDNLPEMCPACDRRIDPQTLLCGCNDR